VARLTSVSWADFVRRLRELEFEGPYRGGKHPYMVRGDLVLTIPNPHRKEISVDLLRRILKRAGISREEWLKNVYCERR
jgi:predicted RNA binding protein YcfA (HicA-like mRNA interferase family)